MNDISELQKIWLAKGDEAINTNMKPDPDSLLKKLKSLENLQTRINIIKIVVIGTLLAFMIYIFPKSVSHSMSVYSGFGIVTTSIVAFMAYYLKNQFKTSKLNFACGSMEFTNQTIELLQKQNAIFRTPFRIFFVSMAIGLNLMLIGATVDFNSHEAILVFLIDNSSLVIFTFIGYRIRVWRIRREVNPLIDELTRTKESLSSGE